MLETQYQSVAAMLERLGYALLLILGSLVIPFSLAWGFIAFADFIGWLVHRYQRFTVRHLLVLTALVAVVIWVVAALFATFT